MFVTFHTRRTGVEQTDRQTDRIDTIESHYSNTTPPYLSLALSLCLYITRSLSLFLSLSIPFLLFFLSYKSQPLHRVRQHCGEGKRERERERESKRYT